MSRLFPHSVTIFRQVGEGVWDRCILAPVRFCLSSRLSKGREVTEGILYLFPDQLITDGFRPRVGDHLLPFSTEEETPPRDGSAYRIRRERSFYGSCGEKYLNAVCVRETIDRSGEIDREEGAQTEENAAVSDGANDEGGEAV